jgi:hypothetical protein
MMLTLISSCGSLERLNTAATTQGRVQARVSLPDWPEDCRKQEAHAALSAGVELRSVLKRERAALDRSNDRVTRCAETYDGIKESFQ